LPSPLKGEGSKSAPPLRGGVGEGVRISTLYTDTKQIKKGYEVERVKRQVEPKP